MIISLTFLLYMLDKLELEVKWCTGIKTYIISATFVVIINGGSSSFFKVLRGLRQGNPLSPLLFFVVMEALNKLFLKARELGLCRVSKVDEGKREMAVTHSFFADDTFLSVIRKIEPCLMSSLYYFALRKYSSLKLIHLSPNL